MKKLEQLIKENYFEKNMARSGIAEGLINCMKLDKMAIEKLEKMGISEAIFYKTRENITNRGDSMAAARYYSQFLDVQKYEMHHTADGNYIIPVEIFDHDNCRHIGGSYILNRRKIEKLQAELKEKQRKTDEKLIELLEMMIE